MAARIHIAYPLTDAPWGGGNQFLRLLKKHYEELGAYSDNPYASDVILFNSHHFGKNCEILRVIWNAKRKNPEIKIVHRVDGPIYSVRGGGIATDRIIFKANERIADGTIFQTQWSKIETEKLGLEINNPAAQIINTADPSFFFPPSNLRNTLASCNKVKLVATSWSSNQKKGFKLYKYLDQNLNFDKFSMTFIGNSPIKFKNIQALPPHNSKELGRLLRKHDIYITASQNDPCSNALCEALACGLPALFLESGGHPEVVRGGGLGFKSETDIISQLELLSSKYVFYRNNIDVPSISQITKNYDDFFNSLNANPKKKNYVDYVSLLFSIHAYKTKEKISNKFNILQ